MRYTHLRKGKTDPMEMVFKDGTIYLFSYERPVALYLPGQGYFAVREEDMSLTNQDRITAFLDKRKAVADPISYDALLDKIREHLRSLGNGRN